MSKTDKDIEDVKRQIAKAEEALQVRPSLGLARLLVALCRRHDRLVVQNSWRIE